MDLIEAIKTIQEAADNWAEYLEENDREHEVPVIDVANQTVNLHVRSLEKIEEALREKDPVHYGDRN